MVDCKFGGGYARGTPAVGPIVALGGRFEGKGCVQLSIWQPLADRSRKLGGFWGLTSQYSGFSRRLNNDVAGRHGCGHWRFTSAGVSILCKENCLE